MEVIFTNYFSAGVSWNKLISEMPTNDAGQKFRIRVRNTFLQVARYLFSEEHKDGCCHSLPGGSEFFDENQQAEIINIFTNHVPDSVPFNLQVILPTEATLGNIIFAIAPHYEIISAEEFTNATYIQFGVIPDISTVQNIIASYIEPEKIENVLLSKKISQNVILTDDGQMLTSIQPNEIIVSKNSGQFATIIAAINFLNTLQDKAVIIRVYPGVYFETESINLPDYACLIGEGSAGNTIIIGLHTGPIINTRSFNFVKNLNLVGGSVGINHDGSNASSFSLVKDCMIKIANSTGISISGGVGSLSVSHISIYADQQAIPAGKGVVIDNGSFIASELIIQAQVIEGLDFVNGLGTLDLVSIYYAQKGLYCTGSTKIKGTLVNLVDCHTGLHLCSNEGSQEKSHVCLNYLHIDRATVDIQFDALSNLEIYSGHIDPDKIIKNVPANLTGNFYTEDEGVQQNIIGNNHVHGSLNFLPNEPFSTSHLSFFENYILLPENAFSFKSNTPITEIFAWSGTDWTAVKFVTYKSFYWLSLDFTTTATTINSIQGFWIKITGDPFAEIEFSKDSIMIAGPEVFYLNRARKLKTIYLTTGNFLTPPGADTSTAYKIIIKANVGITVNGTFYPQNYVETTAVWTQTALQNFTYSVSGLSLLAVSYYELYY